MKYSNLTPYELSYDKNFSAKHFLLKTTWEVIISGHMACHNHGITNEQTHWGVQEKSYLTEIRTYELLVMNINYRLTKNNTKKTEPKFCWLYIE